VLETVAPKTTPNDAYREDETQEFGGENLNRKTTQKYDNGGGRGQCKKHPRVLGDKQSISRQQNTTTTEYADDRKRR